MIPLTFFLPILLQRKMKSTLSVCIFNNCLLMKNTSHSKYIFLSTYLTSGSMDSRLTKIWIRVHQVNSCWQKFLNAVSRILSKMCPVVRYTCALAVHRDVFWWDLVLWPFLFVCLFDLGRQPPCIPKRKLLQWFLQSHYIEITQGGISSRAIHNWYLAYLEFMIKF